MSEALVIWSALEATSAEHAYEVEAERVTVELLDDRAGDGLAMCVAFPEERDLLTLLRIRAASRSERGDDA